MNRMVFFLIIIYLIFLVVLSLHYFAQALSSCSEQGIFFIGVCRLLTGVSSLVVEHRL